MPLISRNSADNRFNFPYFFCANQDEIVIDPGWKTHHRNTTK